MALTQASEGGLKISNAGTNGQFLQKQSGDDGGLTWASVTSGATGSGDDSVFVENELVVTNNYTISATKNALSVGPISINANKVVTIPQTSIWKII